MNSNFYRKALTISGLLLTIFGVFMVYEASSVWAQFKYGDQFYFLKRQALYACVGIGGFFLGSKISASFLKKYANYFLAISFLLLILVLIPGVGLIRGGSASWLGFGGFSFQPSEFLKISLIIFFAKYLEKFYEQSDKIKTILPPLLIASIGFILIMLQPDFGTCMVLAVSLFAQIYASRMPLKWFVIFMFTGIFAVCILILSASYRFERIMSFIDPFQDPLGSGFQIIQSLYAIGPGGLLGQGIGESYQKHYYLPEPQTDFIFAIIVEEFGLFGGLIVIGLYGLMFFCAFKLIFSTKNIFKCYMCLGLLALFMIQVIINLGVVISLFPVTGITLPLISYGGSSLCVLLFSLGLMVNKNEQE